MSNKFRHQLRQEAEQWRAEELIDAALYDQLAERYQFAELDTAARNRFVVILLGLGSILLGLGIITFVAANWQALSREARVVLLLSVFFGVNAAGFYLWRRPGNPSSHRLGQGLLLLGALVLGANLALMSQLFHQSGLLYQLYLVWGLGVLAMAYSLKLTQLGILAIVLIGWGYVQGQPDFVAIGEFSWLRLLVQYMPVVAGVLFIPLAYLCRSRWIFRLGAIAVVCSLESSLMRAGLAQSSAWVAVSACALPPALLWAYRDSLWGRHPRAESFDAIARTLAIVFLGLQFYLLSFRGFWRVSALEAARNSSQVPWSLAINVLLLGSLALWAWLRLGRQLDLTTRVVACLIAISALIPFWHLAIDPFPLSAVFVFNVLLFILAAGLIREGLGQGQRRFFWGGMVLLTLQILSRMLEYETGLLFKSLVLLLCGLGIVAAGLWFERYVRVLS